MRLHRLRIQGFGPFGGTEEVDLDALSTGGLFLLTGPTGAGKTSVLDAICFALYGQVPGARQDGGRLVSDHRPIDLTPEVELEATIAGRRILIRRVAEHERPSRRGGGTTVERPSATLREQEPDGSWRAVSTSLQEIGSELQQLLGMNLDQFAQVVLLPQGGFATFLRADAEERQKLLERLFDARRFKRIEAWLEDEAGRTRRTADEAERAFAQRLAGLVATVPADLGTGAETDDDIRQADPDAVPQTDPADARRATPDGPAEPLPPPLDSGSETGGPPSESTAGALADPPDPADTDAVRTWIATTTARVTAEVERTTAVRRRRSAALDTARRAEQEARERDARAAERRGHVERLAALEADAAARDADRAAIDRARRAEPARGPRRDAVAARVARHKADEQLGKARRWVAGLEADDLDASAPDGWSAARDARDREHAALRGLADREAALPERRRELARLMQEAEQAERDAAAADDVVRTLGARVPTVEEDLRRQSDVAARIDDLRAAAALAAKQTAAARDRDRLAVELRGVEDARRSAVTAYQDARERLLDVRSRRLAGIAAELAGTLGDDEPCPVCGSAEHPRPAAAGTDHVDEAAERAAETEAERLRTAKDAADAAVSNVERARATALAVAGEDPIAVLAEREERATAAVAAAEAAGRASEELRRELGTITTRTDTERQRSASCRETAAATRTRVQALEQEIAGTVAEIDAARGGHDTVELHRSALAFERQYLDKAQQVVREAEAAQAAAADAERRLRDALDAGGLADEAALRAAELTPDAIAELEQWLRRHDDELAAVRAALADPRLATVDPDAPSTAEATSALAADAAAAHEAAITAAATASRAAAELAVRAPQVRAELDRLGPLREARDRAGELHRLAVGTSSDNVKRMRLTAYVLAARLEQVATVASALLGRMSSGRYGLVHHDDRSGRSRSGLGLRVVDGWTGEERDTRTLSGGESFFASLALALALADTVTAESGGRPLETLFIDEGFGSLDEDTLEEVMDVLDELRDGGRVVGIVSHVAELRGRVPTQLQVVKEIDGSHLRTATTTGV
ncbi:MAG: AAA family ATPase [Solirubrobacteraceae bacterium]